MGNHASEPLDDDEATGSEPSAVPVIAVTGWFGEHREVCLEFAGTRYRLRITRRNKLILQK